MKRCSSCNQYKSKREFSWKNLRTGELATYCKPCMREYCRAHYRRNGHKHNQRRYANTVAYKARNRAYVVEFLRTHPCVDCGERDPVVLEFDHVRGSKRGNVSEMVAAGWGLACIGAEIDKCVVRCSNCHRKKTVAQLAWFKSRTSAGCEVESRTGRSSAW